MKVKAINHGPNLSHRAWVLACIAAIPALPNAVSLIYSDVLARKHIDTVEQIQISYPFPESYPAPEKNRQLLTEFQTTKICEHRFDGNLDKIIEKLKENSQKYLTDHSEHGRKLPFSGTSEAPMDDYATVFESAMRECLQEMITTATNDIDEDICALKDYIIFCEYTDLTEDKFWISHDSKTIILYPNQIKSWADYLGISYEQAIKETIARGFNSSRVVACQCRLDKGQKYKLVGNNTQRRVVLELCSQHMEGSQISSSAELLSEEIRNEALMMFLAMFNQGKQPTIEDYNNAILNCNAQQYYDIFGIDLNSEEDLKAFQIISTDVDLKSHFFRNIDLNEEITADLLIRSVGQGYKATIFKMALKNMVRYVQNHADLELKHIAMIYMTMQNALVKEAALDNTGIPTKDGYRIVYDEAFFDSMVAFDREAISFLSEHYQVSEIEIRTMMSEEIRPLVIKLSQVCNANGHTEVSASPEVNTLLDKVPLIRQILQKCPVQTTEWTDFLDAHKEYAASKVKSSTESIVDDAQQTTPQYGFRSLKEDSDAEVKKKTLQYAKSNPEYQRQLKKYGLCYIKETGLEVSCCEGEDGELIYWVGYAETPEGYKQRLADGTYIVAPQRRGGARI